MSKAKPDLRNVELNSFQEWDEEVAHLLKADHEQRVEMLGKWSLGQLFQHLGKWIEFSLDGFPFQYPWGMRMGAKLIKLFSWKLLYKMALKPGFTNPQSASAIEPTPDISADEGASYLRDQIQRILNGAKMTQPSPAAGALTHEQWEWIQLRHAEMHLGFTRIKENGA